MFKNIKLRSKIMGGFLTVLFLTALIGYIGFNSQKKIVAINDKVGDVNQLVNYAKDCRQQEKNFILRGDKKYVDQLHETMGKIYEQITLTMAKFQVQADRDGLAKVESSAKAYQANFDNWVQLWDQQKIAEQVMADNAMAFMGECEKLHGDQDAEFTAVQDIQNKIADGGLAHLIWAGKVKDFLTDKTATLDVQTDGHKCAFGTWIESDEFAKQADLCGQQFVQIISDIKQKHLELHATAVEIQNARKADSDTSLAVFQEKTKPLLEHNLNSFAELKEIINAKAADKLGKADAANQLLKWAKDGRIQEMNFRIRSDRKYQEENQATMRQIVSLCEELAGKFAQQANKDLIAQVKLYAEKYQEGFGNWVALWDQQTTAETRMVENAREFTKICEELGSVQKERMKATVAQSNTLMIVAASVAVIIGVFAALLLTRGITKPFQNIFKGLKTFSTSELTETSATFNEVIDTIGQGVDQVSQSSQSLAEGATEQAASIEETSSSMEEMSSMTQKNADNAQQANTLASRVQQAIEMGNTSMTRMSQAINEIQTSSQETAKIIKVIDEIAFQTNLLALNAAVEAARAGEAGKGFAVVAEEVRNLAMRSAEAAKNTSSMIEASVKNSENGVEITKEVAKGLEEIAAGITKTTELISEIAAASQEQAQGINQVNLAMSQMDKVTQSNAANAEESASAAEEVNSQVQVLQELLRGSSATLNTTVSKPGLKSKAALSHTDKAFHHIAGASQKKKTAKKSDSSMEQFIPMDDGGNGFDDFKS